jgi:hypothetical protein
VVVGGDQPGHARIAARDLGLGDRPRRAARFVHGPDQRPHRAQDAGHGQPSREGQHRGGQRVAEQQPERHAPALGQEVGHVELGHDAADLAALERQGRQHAQRRVAGHPHRLGRHRPGDVAADVVADGRAARIGRRQHAAALVGHHRQQQALPVIGGARAVEDVVDLPDVLAQHRGAERDRQTLDMQPRRLRQARRLHAAERGQHALARHQAERDHQPGRHQRHAQRHGQVAEARDAHHAPSSTAMRRAMPSNSAGSAAATRSR